MRKLKVYLDTSVISYLDQKDSPERMGDTVLLWKMFESEKYDVCISEMTLREINNCYEPKRTFMLEALNKIKYAIVPIPAEAVQLARKIIELGILTEKSIEDCYHIAAAVLADCDCIISWNFKHIVNIKTIQGVRAITNLEGYRQIDILNPSVLLEHSNDESEA